VRAGPDEIVEIEKPWRSFGDQALVGAWRRRQCNYGALRTKYLGAEMKHTRCEADGEPESPAGKASAPHAVRFPGLQVLSVEEDALAADSGDPRGRATRSARHAPTKTAAGVVLAVVTD
jgi:hypothetical protein